MSHFDRAHAELKTLTAAQWRAVMARRAKRGLWVLFLSGITIALSPYIVACILLAQW